MVLSFAWAHLCDTPSCNISSDNSAKSSPRKHASTKGFCDTVATSIADMKSIAAGPRSPEVSKGSAAVCDPNSLHPFAHSQSRSHDQRRLLAIKVHLTKLFLEFISCAILFKIITRIQLLFSNYLGRYSFRAQWELISVTVTVLWV